MKRFDKRFNTDTTFVLIEGFKRYYKVVAVNTGRTLLQLKGLEGSFQPGHILKFTNKTAGKGARGNGTTGA